jgi:hypothetical protein
MRTSMSGGRATSSTLAASYAEVLEVAERFVGRSAEVFGENAVALYGLSSAADG